MFSANSAMVMLVNLTAKATGCYIAINYLTVAAATVLSLPGVIGMLLLNIIFI
ncbi:MAG: pro-sigmaK processing inhibitor BofA family protein [Oscillospiraceae bacterium]|nr:pro-sigmaK processing inhibitor BofA family protein [Oscillospiraceae bacterium]